MVFSNFFRKDLELENRWWHRLLRVVFVVCLAYVVICVFMDMLNDAQFPKYEKVGILSEQMDSEPRLIGDLVSPGEKIAMYEDNLYGAYQGKPLYDGNGGWLLKQEYYCSKNISSQVEKISEKTGIYFYKGNTDLVSLEGFKKYLTEQKAWCVEVRDLYSVEHFGNVKKALAWGLEADGMNVYKVSITKSIFAALQTVFFVFLGFFILLVLYYKIFIYIVFGSRKR